MIKGGYDLERLRREVDSLADTEYLGHPGQSAYWTGVPLRNPTGATRVRLNDIRVGRCKDTEYMQKTPYIRQILDELPAAIHTVRALKIKTGGTLNPHRDGDRYAYEGGTVCRLHLPIYTNPDVKFVIDDVEHHLEAGKLYFTDVSLMHTVHNEGNIDRVHLVIDTDATPAMRDIINAARSDIVNAAL